MTLITGSQPTIWLGIGVLAILLVVAYIVIILLFRRMKKFEAAYVSLKTFLSGNDLEGLLQEYHQKLNEQKVQLEQCSKRLDPIEFKLKASVDRVQMVRYKAFENVGSDLSFALAFLNQDGDGIVLNSIHSREDSRVYAKPVTGGQSTYLLSNEEKEVISNAMVGPKIP
ncbi:hypothetical protein Desaci_4713 [Desulfosporosinus acidiphilus SJ4]|uniref:DUF4446 domain-containing protein n=1 Tax=Desulfosporosinus acidiphilus (strain DSM 22704 / JCM 16185 / SJ4) TaxID=646529 RepID=I4DCL7_DESAJ|nr:DUF4446 family protein [Desulfosporosinus acidiphilus]AFM43541.1 hypothetical protein Desaci_4713 [Desulfosporosinus acidiphilus SJ4]